ncbi:MAG: 23S rRNA (guanosine(2251)-2'-O)-methyltransferase RlmB [Alphaproteobacteria bacterium]|jgi:23S rRNA (guanosine2251-2'-O)-methyltransferase|nr:23S rRNA (guanosine(2251)-2'-O)-methyltransferase RlmB [Alphaproteobacteria bacterium]
MREKGAASSASSKGVLIWGIHAVREAWLNPYREVYQCWATQAGLAALSDIEKLSAKEKLERPSIKRIEKEELEAITPRGSVHQGIVMDVAPLPDVTLDDMLGSEACPDVILILDQVTDPHNVGAIMRSAAAFGAGAIIVTERSAPSMTGTITKTACGAAEHVPLIPVVNMARAMDTLREESYWCIGLAEEGDRDLSACAVSSGRIALVLGAEGDGLRRLTRQHCDELARLPTQPPIGSLNVSNAAAVSLYEVRRQRG